MISRETGRSSALALLENTVSPDWARFAIASYPISSVDLRSVKAFHAYITDLRYLLRHGKERD